MTGHDTGVDQSGAPGLPEPHPRMRELAFFVGEWDAPGLFHETPFFPRKEVAKRIVATAEERGFWIMVRIEELATVANPFPLSSRYLWGYEPETDAFVADWFAGNGGRAVQRSRGWEGDRLVFEGALTIAGTGFGLRDTFTRTGEDSFHHLGEIHLDGWIPADEQHAVRTNDALLTTP
ncbi:hypothetical protein [Glycomyces harbinensis]|uniref:THAP4-like heme-binding beta-barrel domain-containing protein n=1 Tax=Glycomyces harbinensis TaxID=58114 RepID=A0A1G6ZLW5_9ACTN|nr:hypothetical protein [Glycomyces harbinensis]SDE03413.1 hypothetical protein SAMN05216270_11175 [Glycomyces harbinensis]